MCGFFFIFKKVGTVSVADISIAKRCTELIDHRGPDDTGFFSNDEVVVGFKRLSIQDLTTNGHQPFITKNKNQVLAFNGEIYNFVSLRHELSHAGENFVSTSDTEVLIKLLQREGTNVFSKLRGMFSFVYWDQETSTLIVARDRFGIKPLYVHENDTHVVCASEIKCLLEYDKRLMVINQKSAIKYLSRGFLDDTEETFYKDIKSFPAGHFREYSNSGVVEKRFWNAADFLNGTAKFDPETYKEKFFQTVNLHSISDAPSAISLSGGLDSTSILASSLALNSTREPNSEGKKFKCFTMSPPDTTDESDLVDQLVNEFNLTHEYIACDLVPGQIEKLIDEILWYHDEPIQQASTIYHYLLRKRVSKQNCKVLLVGEGADEVLAGYRRMVLPYLLAIKAKDNKAAINSTLNGAAQLLRMGIEELKLEIEKFDTLITNGESGRVNTQADSLFKSEVISKKEYRFDESMFIGVDHTDYEGSFKKLLLSHLTKRNIPYVLRMEDRNSMACGVESRVPFLDHDFFEYIFSHSVREFMQFGENKSMLRRAMNKILPAPILEKKTKVNRPGSHSHLVYSLMPELIINAIEKSSNFFLKSPNLLKNEFIKDLNNKATDRADFWFRFYVYERWKTKILEENSA